VTAPLRVRDVDVDEVAAFLASCRPLEALTPEQLSRAARRAAVEHYRGGEEILDAFAEPGAHLYAVWQGRVEIWSHADRLRERPDETLVKGGLFGYVAPLIEKPVGPRAVAAGDAVVVRLGADLAAPAFASRSGARFLAEEVAGTNERLADTPSYTLVDNLIVRPPLIVEPSMSIAATAAAMEDARLGYAAVSLRDGRYGLVTDVDLRRVVGSSVPTSRTVAAVMSTDPPVVRLGVSAAEALIKILDTDADYILVIDRAGLLRGVVAPRDFAVSSTTAGASLHEQIRRAQTPDELQSRFQQAPRMLHDLLRRGLAPSRVITVYSAIVDTLIRTTITVVFQRHPELDADAFTWLSLGSNGRREAVPSSDIDAAAAFDNGLQHDDLARYAPLFEEVADVLLRAGLSHDRHGASPTNPDFRRKHADWRSAANSWLTDATQDRAVIMTCLLLDGRPIMGDPGLPEVAKVFADLRRHPQTMRLLLRASIATPRKVHRPTPLIARRRRFLFKAHALTPIANIARWAAMSIGSSALPTRERLLSGAGSEMLSESDATSLLDIFEVVQGIRLRRQLDQVTAGLPPSDSVRLRELSAIDRSVVLEAVGEIHAVQRKMRNVAALVLPEMRPGPPGPDWHRTR
jgi:CBS domain-containing protein